MAEQHQTAVGAVDIADLIAAVRRRLDRSAAATVGVRKTRLPRMAAVRRKGSRDIDGTQQVGIPGLRAKPSD